MVSTKPYLLRAIYQWCVDQGLTPHLLVTVDAHTHVPRQYIENGRIVLNLGPEAVHQLQMGDEEISFKARFSGTAFSVLIPVSAVTAIYARENGHGMSFEAESSPDDHDDEMPDTGPAEPDESPPPSPPAGRPHLTRVK